MVRHTFAAAALITISSTAVAAQDFAGTWTGRLPSGTPVQLNIPAGYAQGQPVIYFFNNQQQGTQTVTMAGNQMRLSAGGSSIMLGPVKGKSMPYTWTNGQNQAKATLTKQ